MFVLNKYLFLKLQCEATFITANFVFLISDFKISGFPKLARKRKTNLLKYYFYSHSSAFFSFPLERIYTRIYTMYEGSFFEKQN